MVQRHHSAHIRQRSRVTESVWSSRNHMFNFPYITTCVTFKAKLWGKKMLNCNSCKETWDKILLDRSTCTPPDRGLVSSISSLLNTCIHQAFSIYLFSSDYRISLIKLKWFNMPIRSYVSFLVLGDANANDTRETSGSVGILRWRGSSECWLI